MRRSPRATFAVLLAIAALGAWLALSSFQTERSSPPTAERAPVRSANEAPPGQRFTRYLGRKQRPGARTRPRSETPRSRLAADHTPASGPALATLRIPAIGVRAPVIKLGLNPDRTLQVPANSWKTGLWAAGASPGQRGSAVIVGHVDSRAGPAVFFRLGDLNAGDTIRVTRRGGKTTRFVVVRKAQVSKDDFPTRQVYGDTPEPTLRLITCAGGFDEEGGHYSDNLVVTARAPS